MPQLMPMFWKSSVFMGFMLLLVMVVFYFFKKMEDFMMKEDMKLKMIKFEFLW
uniref:ATP synthase F0 subunit 8 n=1 Tax=Oxyopes sertatus TaxID=93706 RepID=A0A0U1XBP8_OXYSE|nr:ATP synthase F0 subunit 8 [Oxyopes sertatus]AIP86896.1 ATP synthase F0 subunit 8 [Oxyopes sertatus]